MATRREVEPRVDRLALAATVARELEAARGLLASYDAEPGWYGPVRGHAARWVASAEGRLRSLVDGERVPVKLSEIGRTPGHEAGWVEPDGTLTLAVRGEVGPGVVSLVHPDEVAGAR